MQAIYRTSEIRQLEQVFATANPGVSLMERAGLAAAEKARDMLGDGYRVLVACGPGNNGGDALVAARHLLAWDYRVTTALLADMAKLPPDAATAYHRFSADGGTITAELPDCSTWDLIVDGLLGIGLTRPVKGALAAAVARINASASKVLSLDVPSGLDSDTGNVQGVAIRASATLTFLGLKSGLLTGDGKDCCGELSTAPLDVDCQRFAPAMGALLDQASVSSFLPRRLANSHKGSFGSVGILGGSDGMQGAAALAGRAALKLGAGRVTIGTPTRLLAGYDPAQPELMWRGAEELLALDHLTALVAGPGLGRSGAARVLLARAIDTPLPLLLDADGLNLLASHEPLQSALALRDAPILLTPHPAEAARLLDSDVPTVQGNRVDAALELARHFRAAIVLKGAGSIVALPDGRWFINPTGNPGMASAGMGDVLSGMVGALLAQRLSAERALQLGVYLHGAAADALVGRGIGPVGLVASEVIDEARRLINASASRGFDALYSIVKTGNIPIPQAGNGGAFHF